MILLSHNLNKSTPEYANGDSLKIFSICSMSNDDSCNKMGLSLDLYTGTHEDFSRHFCNKCASFDEMDNHGIFSFLQWKLLDIEVELIKTRRQILQCEGKVFCDKKLMSEMTFMASVEIDIH